MAGAPAPVATPSDLKVPYDYYEYNPNYVNPNGVPTNGDAGTSAVASAVAEVIVNVNHLIPTVTEYVGSLFRGQEDNKVAKVFSRTLNYAANAATNAAKEIEEKYL